MKLTELLGQLVAFCTLLAFIWEASKTVSKAIKNQADAIRESATAQAESQLKATTSQAESQAKSKAEKARTEALWAVVEVQGEMIEEICDYLSKPLVEREKSEFRIRKATKNLEEKAFDRLKSYRTDFT